MATLSLLDRERTRTRDRPRPSVPGNFITAIIFSSLYSLTLPPHLQSYIKWWPYSFPETKALGYFDNPVIVPVWIAMGPVSKPQAVFNIANGLIPGVSPGISTPITIIDTPTSIVPIGVDVIEPIIPTGEVSTPAVLPEFIVPGSTLITETAHRPGMTFSSSVGLAPVQLFNTTKPIRGVTILADSANAGTVWIGYDPQIQVDNGFVLAAGAAKDLNIDDLSSVWLIASAASQIIHVEYTI